MVVESLNVDSTKALLQTLKSVGAGDDMKRSRDSKKVRTGQGKMRNSRYVLRRGPLIVYGEQNENVKRTARNLPGVDFVNVHRLNLLQLAPGGHLGRFVIWTQDAFKSLNNIFGNYRRTDIEKGGYVLQRNVVNCADLARIINSDQVQAKLRAVKTSAPLHTAKKNPLTNRTLMKRLNPFDAVRRANEQKTNEAAHKSHVANHKKERKATKKAQAVRRKAYNAIWKAQAEAFEATEAAFQRIGADAPESEEEDEDEQ